MKSILKKFVPFILIFALALSFTACDDNNKPEVAVTNLIAALKEMDMEKAQQYISTSSLTTVTVDNLADGDMVIEAAFSNLSVDIIDVQKNGNTAVVKAKMSTIDLEAIMGECTQIVMREMMTGVITDEQIDARLDEVFKETLAKEGNPVFTQEVNINTIKVEGSWKVVSDDNFQNAISGGFLGAVANAQSDMFAAE